MIEAFTDFYPASLWVYAVISISTLIALVFIDAPYGRHMRDGWGPSIRAPWGWLIMEGVALLVMPLCVFISGAEITPLTLVFLLMWCGHYGNRALGDSWRMRDTKKTMPLIIMLMAVFYNILNGYTNGWHFLVNAEMYAGNWLLDPRFIIGVSIFLIGASLNIRSDQQLRRLREEKGPGYHVPNAGLHRYIAAPNYFAEILEWIGWAIAVWSIPGALFAFYTFCNLAPRAHAHYTWYKSTFPDYPDQRKRLIPFVW